MFVEWPAQKALLMQLDPADLVRRQQTGIEPFRQTVDPNRQPSFRDSEKQFKNGISVFFKANNLLDAKRERYLKTVNKSNLEDEGQKSDKTIVGTYQYGRTFLLGVRYKL